MSHNLSFVELINLAIGTPELGNVNFNALHLLLHSLVEHLHLQDMRKEVSADELEFIKPPASSAASAASAATSATETLPTAQESSSIFHQMHERITAIEKQLQFLNESPDTAELLVRSQGLGQPALDMWQMMQLKKKMELNEEGMTKVTPLGPALRKQVAGPQTVPPPGCKSTPQPAILAWNSLWPIRQAENSLRGE